MKNVNSMEEWFKRKRIVCCHVTYTFQSESTLYSCLNVKELLARNRHKIWRSSDCNWTRTHNHLVCKWLSVRLPTKSLWVWVQLQPQKELFYKKIYGRIRYHWLLVCWSFLQNKDRTTISYVCPFHKHVSFSTTWK